ncbi:PAS domain S-box protein [Marinomonas sp. FW-1]|uniref:PAS domain S-box protein n=1 Tax=Marinomonas sp. FW-1 TaxID=2071621 RepID=UPI0010BF6707|nr:PAS domain S-box protein [Marinomonas sp. FW-1]
MQRVSFESIFNRWVLITLLLTITVALAIAYKVHEDNKVQINKAALEAANTLQREVQTRIELYQYGLRGARGAILTTGENLITRKIFTLYSLSRDVDVEFPGARGFGFIRRVTPSEESAFVDRARKDGWPEFSVKSLNPNFNERYIIQYIEPVDRNRQAVGLDIASEKNRREAAASALYSGEVRLTGPITLVQATGKPQQSFLILMPIYHGGSTPLTQAERLQKGFGWSYAPLIMGEVLSGLPVDVEKLHYELWDITDLDEPVQFYGSSVSGVAGYEQVQTTKVYGREWRSVLRVTPAFIQSLRLPSPVDFLSIGLLISLLLTVVVVVIRLYILRNREVMTHQARISAVVESSADGIVSSNMDGEVVSWNSGAERILGYSKEEAIGKNVVELLVPNELRFEALKAIATLKESKEPKSIETRRTTKSGTEIPVSITLSPILDANKKVVGVSKSIRDISERKKAEAKIFELNSNLESQVKARTAELRELNLLLSDVLSASSEVSIIATDLNGVIKLFNKGAERMLGYSADEVVGKLTPVGFHDEIEIDKHRIDIFEATGETVSDSLDVLIHHALQGDFESKEWTYIHKDGSTRPVSLVVTLMKGGDNNTVGYLGMAMDITEQKSNQQALIYTRDQLLLAAEAAQLGIWSLNIADDVLEWSDLMLSMYQFPLSKKDEGITYDEWFDRVHPEDRDTVTAALKDVIDNKGSYDVVFRIILPDGSIRHILASAILQKDSDGQVMKVTGINRDITKEYELETWLRKAKDEAIAANVAKSNFLANMSHEIRTPMNAILGMLHLVKRTPLTNQQDDYISKAQISAKSLLALINDVLDFSKVDAGKLELEKAPFEVEALLCELSTVLSGSSLGKNVELIFDIDRGIPAFLVGDKLRLLQILINLVSNAVKFTLEGSVVLKIQQQPAEAGVVRLTVSVQDTGIGIAEDKLDSIFEVFSQAESSTARRFGGSGLGLVISRRFVELMGGSLQVESELGKGSRFYFTVDLPISDIKPELPFNNISSKPLQVLIVDENVATQAIFTRMAFGLGWTSKKAESIQGAIVLLRESLAAGDKYNAILLDTKTSDFLGQESINEVNSIFPDTDRAPKIILLSSAINDQLDNKFECISGSLLKPATVSQLSETVYQALSGDASSLPDRLSNDYGGGNLIGVKVLLVEDNAFNRQVATELLAIEGAVVTVEEGGLEGVATVLNHDVGAFDIVLMDMQMPGIDGLEATKQIRKDTRFASLPIIAMTANVSESDRQACFRAGMNDHIAKPLDIDKMVACILKHTNTRDELVTQEDAKDSVVEPTEKSTPTVELSDYEDIESILSRFGGSIELYNSVIEGFTQESEDLLAKIAQSVESRDRLAAAETLHTLKGASLTMGLQRFASQVFIFEKTLKTTEDNALVEACLSSIDSTELRAQLQEEMAIILQKMSGKR